MEKPQPPANPSPLLLDLIAWAEEEFAIARECDRVIRETKASKGDFITEVLTYIAEDDQPED